MHILIANFVQRTGKNRLFISFKSKLKTLRSASGWHFWLKLNEITPRVTKCLAAATLASHLLRSNHASACILPTTDVLCSGLTFTLDYLFWWKMHERLVDCVTLWIIPWSSFQFSQLLRYVSLEWCCTQHLAYYCSLFSDPSHVSVPAHKHTRKCVFHSHWRETWFETAITPAYLH